MSPTEFAIRMIAADQRFSRALKRDDIRDMRAALAEKTALLQLYFSAARGGADDGKQAREPAPRSGAWSGESLPGLDPGWPPARRQEHAPMQEARACPGSAGPERA